MIKLQIDGVHFKVDDKIKSYLADKIGNLDRYMPGTKRESLRAHVVLKEEGGAAKQRFICEVSLAAPHQMIEAKESAPNTMYAAIDMAEDAVKRQLEKYKAKRQSYRHKAREWARRVKRFGRP